MVELLRHEDFVPHVGKRFRFPNWHADLLLAAIEPQPHATMPGVARTPFTLLLHGPVGDILREGLYQASIEDGPTLEIYVMPIHTVARDRQDYQAVFN